MGGNFTESASAVRFPHSLYKSVGRGSVDDKIDFLYETIEKIEDIFIDTVKCVTWDERKLSQFLDVLGRQSLELRTCGANGRKYERRLRSYFGKLRRKVLKQMNYSCQAWELIRKEVRQHLRLLYYVYSSMK